MKHSPESPLPKTWMSADIKLGSLTIHMNDQDWIKGQVERTKSDVNQLIEDFEHPQPKKVKEGEISFINPGRQLLHKVMNKTKEILNKEQED